MFNGLFKFVKQRLLLMVDNWLMMVHDGQKMMIDHGWMAGATAE